MFTCIYLTLVFGLQKKTITLYFGIVFSLNFFRLFATPLFQMLSILNSSNRPYSDGTRNSILPVSIGVQVIRVPSYADQPSGSHVFTACGFTSATIGCIILIIGSDLGTSCIELSHIGYGMLFGGIFATVFGLVCSKR